MRHAIGLAIWIGFGLLGLGMLSGCKSEDTPIVPAAAPAPQPPPSPRPLGEPLYGVTVDDVEPIADIVAALSGLARRPTTRIVFDEFVPATYYVEAVDRIHAVSFIMGELLDSQYVSQVSVDTYARRAREYLDTLGDKVDIWEIGNEINGEWLGDIPSVVAKMRAAFEVVEQRGGRTALTLYYNEGCWKYPSEEMFAWVEANVPSAMRVGLDYVLLSYYEEDCNDLRPDWQAVFARLAMLFPQSKLGFGEVGTSRADRKSEYIQRYYSLRINAPRYVGGYFWWYFVDDMVPKSKPLWGVLNDSLARAQ